MADENNPISPMAAFLAAGAERRAEAEAAAPAERDVPLTTSIGNWLHMLVLLIFNKEEFDLQAEAYGWTPSFAKTFTENPDELLPEHLKEPWQKRVAEAEEETGLTGVDAVREQVEQNGTTEEEFLKSTFGEVLTDQYGPQGALHVANLIALIVSNESAGGNYNIYNNGTKEGGLDKNLTSMTLREVMDIGSAAGKYQIIPGTMEYLIGRMGLSENDIYTERLQDEMGLELLKRRGLDKYIAGEITMDEFINELALEWAALPKDASGDSALHNSQNPETAETSYESVVAAVKPLGPGNS